MRRKTARKIIEWYKSKKKAVTPSNLEGCVAAWVRHNWTNYDSVIRFQKVKKNSRGLTAPVIKEHIDFLKGD